MGEELEESGGGEGGGLSLLSTQSFITRPINWYWCDIPFRDNLIDINAPHLRRESGDQEWRYVNVLSAPENFEKNIEGG